MPVADGLATHPDAESVAIRRIGFRDLGAALGGGFADLGAKRTDAVFLVLLYPLIGLVIATLAAGESALHLVFPLVSGFALVGPLAASGLYEISRQREAGSDPGLLAAYRSAIARAGGRLFVMAVVLFSIFAAWIGAASLLWHAIMGGAAPGTPGGLLAAVFGSEEGWLLVVVGNLVGALFAALALVVSVFSLPMLIDGERSVATAIATSVRACAGNPRAVLAWGAIVGFGLALASIPALVGLMVALPLFGHATWRLYRRTIAR